jgi:NAD(P)-dependent dehydrogenase (short-subunit alcohol dehydrogenase family)
MKLNVDILFNNAGIATPNHPHDPVLASSAKDMMACMQTNLVGTMIMTQKFLPLMEGGSKTIVNMSSVVASVHNTFGCQGAMGNRGCYRTSKCAVNMLTRTFAAELDGRDYKVIAISPGHVATEMGTSGGRSAPLTIDMSCKGMLKVISNLKKADNGKFMEFDGSILPW